MYKPACRRVLSRSVASPSPLRSEAPPRGPGSSASRTTGACGIEPLSDTRPAECLTSPEARNLRAPRQLPASADRRRIRRAAPSTRSARSGPCSAEVRLRTRARPIRSLRFGAPKRYGVGRASTAPRVDSSDLQHRKRDLPGVPPSESFDRRARSRRRTRREPAAKKRGPPPSPPRRARGLRSAIERSGESLPSLPPNRSRSLQLDPGSTLKPSATRSADRRGRPSEAPSSSEGLLACCLRSRPASFRLSSRRRAAAEGRFSSSALYLQCG